MKDIDFLPDGYRQQHSGHNVRLWRVVVVVVFLAMLSVASFVQYLRLCHARYYLAQIATQYTAAENQNGQLTRLQSELNAANRDAELFTYLRHPWPRTQILAALIAPLPDSITLTQLEIKVDSLSGLRRGQARRRQQSEKADEQLAAKLPAEQDLAWFREQLDSAPVTVVLSGRTTDPDALHRYLGKLDRCSLFMKAELDSLKSLPSNDKDTPEGTMSFTAVVVVCPGYGQPGGPVGSVHVAHHNGTTTEQLKQIRPVKPSRERVGILPKASAQGGKSL